MYSRPPHISLIVPVYNVEKFLPFCLESMLNQTLLDVEMICIDDGSTDASPLILEAYAKKDPRFRIIHQSNQGVSAARNTGIQAATGEWIMFLDSDDLLKPNACERVWIEANEKPTDIIIYGGYAFPNHPPVEPWLQWTLSVPTMRCDAFEPKILFHTAGAKPFVWQQAYSRNFITGKKIMFREDLRLGEDITFQFEAFPQALHFSFISDTLYLYRWYREGSIMAEARKNLDKKIADHIIITEHIADIWNQKGWIQQYGPHFLSWLLEFTVHELFAYSNQQKKELAKKIISLIEHYKLQQYKGHIDSEARHRLHYLHRLS